MKQVGALKDKHRDDLWVDAEGDIWFYDGGNCYWRVLGKRSSPGWNDANLVIDGCAHYKPDSASGLYSRVFRGYQ